MRITFGNKYNQMNYYQNILQNKLDEANLKIATGNKIQYGYQDSSIFNQNLKLEYDIHSLNQSLDIAEDANFHTLNNDEALTSISTLMDDFKTKLIHAGNDVHSPTSRQAIAKDLRAIRENIINIANTQIGGEYIFSGSKVKVKPFDEEGNYYGNNEKLKALIAPHASSAYNIHGEELFLSKDLDKYKKITTNIRMFNQVKLHPEVYNELGAPTEVYITANDTLEELLGGNSGHKEVFYLRGHDRDGISFKEKFSLDKDVKVQTLLDRIGEAYGNTSDNKLVNVNLNEWGEIEIVDTKVGASYISFNLIASEEDVEDIATLGTTGVATKEGGVSSRVFSFQQSPFLGEFTKNNIKSIVDPYDFRKNKIPIKFMGSDNHPASLDTNLSDIFSPETSTLRLTFNRPNNADHSVDNTPIEPLIIDVGEENMRSMLDKVRNYLEAMGKDIVIEMYDGEISIIDNNVDMSNKKIYDGDHGFSMNIETLGIGGENVVNGIREDYRNNYAKTYFLKDGATIKGNISQVDHEGNYVTGDVKLSDVANTHLDNETYMMKLKDHNGVDIESKLEFTQEGVFLILPNRDQLKGEYEKGDGNYRIPMYNPHDRPPAISVTSSDEFSYQQLMDAMLISLNFSNYSDEDLRNAQGSINHLSEVGKKSYEDLIKSANAKINVGINDVGQIEIYDKFSARTKMDFMIYELDSDVFNDDNNSSLIFNANVALDVIKPQINFFKYMDEMIKAVDEGIYRPGAMDDNYSSSMLNIGIQNSIDVFDMLSDRVEKMVGLNGSYGKFFENSIRRNEVLKVQVASLKGETIGADYAKTYNEFSNLSNNYNAVLATTSRINRMNLLDFL